jgi:superfamily II DNA helicase RecQ
MHVRVVTLVYDSGLKGFPETPLQQVVAGAELTDVREHFFVHGGVPHLCMVLVLDEPVDGRSKGQSRTHVFEEDWDASLPENVRPLYRTLRRWRNETARKEGIPSYVIMRNRQLAEIARRLPHSLVELREIEGVGEATCAKYGRDVLALIPVGMTNTQSESPERTTPRVEQSVPVDTQTGNAGE